MGEKQNVFAHRGLTLSQLARRYVVRGIESGGAVKEIGRYITFCGANGEPLPYLHPIDSIGENGWHAVVVAPILVRIELFRSGRTCQLLITRHEPGKEENGRRPPPESRVLFRGVNGFLAAEQPNNESQLSCSAIPRFWSRAGEECEIPLVFAAAVQAATKGAKCIGCSHAHYLVKPIGIAG